ncbi:aminodeoxychorismate/anthranilate synthase component II [Dactylosporangium roseum]|uniref:Aminodeoxychorismate/anthranilate synthase component II n=1 Tax=Dactylosporangium roseum TaxID=47989 RepID=A0ABY5ZDU0_9ACTN|nr:aminodeoxychorismate/anthranilate synthase component II [Dactylosporangium roseum]UWZ39120.1 aminodeoxychorismate/anthranilate synthase component II [Dactylosporangium roseum]
MKTLVVDAYDSFVHIIRQYLLSLGAGPVVARPDELSTGAVERMRPDAIVLGPGPGHPSDSGHVELVRHFAGRLPILGVCLGHQAVAVAFGADVRPAEHLVHGKTSPIRHDGAGLFDGCPSPFLATRYHSLVVVPETLPDALQITARSDDDGYVMGLRHERFPVETVQFHPESVCTEDGRRLLANFLKRCPTGPRSAA